MPHEFESGLTVGEVSWHGLEKNVPAGSITDIRVALAQGGIDWLVATKPVYGQLDDGSLIELGEFGQWVQRLSDGRALAVVGAGWRPIQNNVAFPVLQPLCDAGYMSISTVGSLRGGQRTYMSFELNREAAEVVPGDLVKGYFVAYQGFDGKIVLSYKHSATRPVCANTLKIVMANDSRMDLGYSEQGVRIPHNSGAAKAVADLADNIKQLAADFEASIELFRQTARKQVNPQKFFERLLGIEGLRKQAEEDGIEFEMSRGKITLGRLMEAYEEQPGREFAPGSGWQAYNAVTYFVDHKRGKDENRLENSWFGAGANLNREALKLALTC